MKKLTQQERLSVFELLAQWTSKYEIAKRLGRHHSTIGREIERNSKWKYDPLKAQTMYRDRKTRTNGRRCKLLNNKGLRNTILTLLTSKDEDWSPDAIVGRLKEEGKESVCTKTVYNYINSYKPIVKKSLKYKCGYRKARRWLQAGQLNDTIQRIDSRPKTVEGRKRIGHREWDTVISRNRSCALVTMVERKTRYLVMAKVADCKAETIHNATVSMLDAYKERVKTITIDNGKEFADVEITEVCLGVRYYRAHPYHSRERWTNEHTNGMIRKHLPKKFDFKALQDHEILAIQEKINKKPRRLLWYSTPYELFYNKKLAYFSHLCVSK